MQEMLQGGSYGLGLQEVWLIFMDRLADAINTIKTNEYIGRQDCVVYSTKLIRAVLDAMKREGYIAGYDEFVDRNIKKLKIALSNKVNDIGVIKPRFSIKKDDILKYEMRYVPSKDFGTLIVSTPEGVMTSRELKGKNTGGRLLVYVY